MSDIKAIEYKIFEKIKYRDENGTEYWLARELVSVLGYTKWDNFQRVIDRAMLACKNSGFEVADQFAEVNKFVEMPTKPRKSNEQEIGFPDIGKTKTKAVIDYRLSRYACYLIVQNGDPRKELIALGQTYFAIQTRRQEVQDYFEKLDEENKRLVIRGDIKQWNQMLAETAYKAGVIDEKEYARFQNAGYMGLYGGEAVEDIHKRKGLKPKEKILDFMNSSELAANLFRITLADEKIKKENIALPGKAIHAHNIVGQEVRGAIKRAGGILPEDQPTPEKSVERIAREQIKQLKKKKNLMFDE
ncbi:MAG: DNA damage-inducible protein D [Leptospirales bacterium]|nr:DNA damage-inducible protein D [Leptospirales bacterium]